jgi:hypothetical protein
MIKYYLIGNWIGTFRTKSEINTSDQFISWLNEYDVKQNEHRIYILPDNGRVVIEEIDKDFEKMLNYPKIGI